MLGSPFSFSFCFSFSTFSTFSSFYSFLLLLLLAFSSPSPLSPFCLSFSPTPSLFPLLLLHSFFPFPFSFSSSNSSSLYPTEDLKSQKTL